MLIYAILLATGIAGYAGAPALAALAAAAGLTLADWRPWRLSPQDRRPRSPKAIGYLVAGLVAHLVLAAIAFGAGRLVRQMLG